MRLKFTVLFVVLISILCLYMCIPSFLIAQNKPGIGMYFRLVIHGEGPDPFWVVVEKGRLLSCYLSILAKGNLWRLIYCSLAYRLEHSCKLLKIQHSLITWHYLED